MKTLYLDCQMGAAGDMLTAALLELVDDKNKVTEKLNKLGIPGVHYEAQRDAKCGITGTHMKVMVYGEEEQSEDVGEQPAHVHDHHDHDHEHHHDHEHDHDCDHDHHDHEHHHDHNHDHDHSHHHDHDHVHHHHHSSMSDIITIIGALPVSQKVKDDIINVYALIAEAESHVHGVPVEEIHFHEVGTMDAVADVAAVCILMDELQVERVAASPIHVGSGQVRCAHGILPVPAPATAYILQGVPTYGGRIRGELCTPTGAALLKYFVNEYCAQPQMIVSKIGYGLGTKEFEQANVIRAVLGDTSDSEDRVMELACNLDDMTAEEIGFAMEQLLSAGALDVYTIPIGMKKNRPGTLLTCMCKESRKQEMLKLIFMYTTTIGVREYDCNRYTLSRREEVLDTEFGKVRRKTVSGWGVTRSKLEYEDLAQAAREKGCSVAKIRAAIEKNEKEE